MTDLNVEKERIKTNLQAYLPAKLDGDFLKISNKLDAAIQATSVSLYSMSTKMESNFQKKLEQHSKNELEDAIDTANHLIRRLGALSQNSEDQTLKACYVADTRIDSIIDSKQFTIALDKKAKDNIN